MSGTEMRARLRARVVSGLALVLAGSATACASTSPEPAFRDVADVVQQRSGHRPSWDRDNEATRQTDAAIDRLLASDLQVEGAVQIALLASPHLRATFEELAIGQADLVQAGLLKNPVLGVGMSAWESEHIDPNVFVSIEQDFLQLLTLPMKKRVAETELEATKLRVADEVLRVSAEVRAAFYGAQAAEQVVLVRRLVQGASEAAAELARRQHEAGNLSDLALANELGMASQVRVDLRKSEGESAIARERLTRLMGMWGARTAWKLAPRLPELPPVEVPLERLESLAIRNRLDIGAARREVQAIDSMLSLTSTARWTGFINVEVEAARLRGSKRISFGPRASIELPLFDQRQAAVARLESLKRSSEAHLQAMSIDVRSEVRTARSRVVVARDVVDEYRKVLVPQRESVVRLSQEQYDAMLIGVHQLLNAKQAEFATYKEYIEALRDYWIARSDLERAVATRLTAPQASPRGAP